MQEKTETEYRLEKGFKLFVFTVTTLSIATICAFFFVLLIRYTWCQTGLEPSCDDAYSIDRNVNLVRNLVLGAGAIIGLKFANDRIRLADKQLKFDEYTADQQTYYEAAKLLQESAVFTRVAGITKLAQLKDKRPAQFSVAVVDILASFIVSSISEVKIFEYDVANKNKKIDYSAYPDSVVNQYAVSYDAEVAMIAIGARTKRDLDMYENEKSDRRVGMMRANLNLLSIHNRNLSHIDFSHSKINAANFSKVDLGESMFISAELSQVTFRNCTCIATEFHNVDMSKATLERSNFDKAHFVVTDLTSAVFKQASVSNANFTGANLCNADLVGAVGLKQEQLDVACQSPGPPPKLSEGYEWDQAAAIERWKAIGAQLVKS